MTLASKLVDRRGVADCCRRHVRGFSLTDAGQALVAYGHRLLGSSDEAMEALLGGQLAGSVRPGVSPEPDDAVASSSTWLRRGHPRARLAVEIADDPPLAGKLSAGTLDVIAGYAARPRTGDAVSEPLGWVGQRRNAAVLQLVVRPAAWRLRDVSEHVLAAAGMVGPTRVGPPAVAALCGAVAAGEGVTLLSRWPSADATAGPLGPEARLTGTRSWRAGTTSRRR